MASSPSGSIDPTQFRLIVNQLKRSKGADPYMIYYGLRTPSSGPCSLGWHGVEDTALIDVYAAALRRAHEYFSGHHWKPPLFDRALGHIPVYVCDYLGIPFTSFRGEYTFHGLRSEIMEPTFPGLLARAELEACHEAFHSFSHVHRPLKDGLSALWSWFDEASAVYFERVLCPGNLAPLEYAKVWINRPEDPVESTMGGYSAAWFIQHLVQEHGPDFLRDVWQPARPDETPVAAINRLLGTKGTFEDLFHRYSVAAYVTELIDGHAFQRFGRRRFSYIARLDGDEAGPPDPWSDTLGPLGCRYYKIDVGRNKPVDLRLEVRPSISDSLARLSAEVILDRTVGWPANPVPLRWITTPRGEARLQAEVTVDDSVSQVVLVVVNTQSRMSVAADDVINRAYQVQVTMTGPPPTLSA